jgi:hypothetical protein
MTKATYLRYRTNALNLSYTLANLVGAIKYTDAPITGYDSLVQIGQFDLNFSYEYANQLVEAVDTGLGRLSIRVHNGQMINSNGMLTLTTKTSTRRPSRQ